MLNLSAFDRNKSYFDRGDLKRINFNLLYHKFPEFDRVENKFIFYRKKEKRQKEDIPEYFLGSKLNKGVSEEFFDPQKISKVSENYYKQIKALGYYQGPEDKPQTLELTPEWRMVVGLGNESVYETGMTLHHIYGFPYIPASAVKGITNHYAKEEYESEKEKRHLIFGVDEKEAGIGNAKQGKVIFFDAFPTGKIILSPDIMNNHYPKYYDGGEKPPADWQSPNPIFFLTVKNTAFRFALAIKQGEDSELLELAKEWLEEALSENGIGAKTAVGYGYMSES